MTTQLKAPSLIISASSHRSGSTWIQRIINAATDILIWGESYPLVELMAYLYNSFVESDLVRSQETHDFFSQNQDPKIWIANMNPPLDNLKKGMLTLLSEFYNTPLPPGKVRYGWKEVRYGRYELEFLWSLFPDLRVILLVRNPIDVVQSLKNLGWIGRWEYTKNLETICLQWSQNTRDYLTLQGHPNVFFIRYEDVLNRIGELLAFVGGRFNDTVKEALYARTGAAKDQEMLSREEIQLILKICANEMMTLGYIQAAKPPYIINDKLDDEAMKQYPLIKQLQNLQFERGDLRIRLTRAEAEQTTLAQKIQILQTQLAERDQAITQLEKERLNMEQHLQAQLASLQQRLSWKRYRIADRLLGYYWYLWHPKQAWQRAKARAWELGRRWLPYGAKRLIKRFILNQDQVPAILTNSSVQTLITPLSSSETSAFKAPRLSCYDVIYFPIIDWNFRYQRSQHFCSQFALHGHRVFYLRTTFKKIQQSGSNSMIRIIKENVYEVQLPGPEDLNIYHHNIPPQVLNIFFEAFQQLRREHSIHEAICIVALPFWRPLAAKLREAFGWKIIYDCMDEHQGFSTNQLAMLAEESQLAHESDLVITTSSKLLKKMSEYNPNTLLIPNATDFKHFSAPFGDMPLELKGLPRPIVGYYGAIADWFDTALIGYLAQRRPKWSFVLIGSTWGADLQPLQGLSNVHLLGEKPYIKLPGYLHQFDVCVIPFKLTPLTEATNPVKFFEFLSAGKPVVSVPLPELLPYEKKGLIYIARTPDEFVEQIERALREDNLERIHARMRFAASQTWEERFNSLYRAIRALYPKVSIIILTKDNLHLTQLCLDSIYRNTLYPNFEVIIVDNASTDGTREYLQRQMETHQNLRVILNEENKGFAHANNQGILNASGSYIVLLNNDTVVTRGWLGGLVRYLESDSKVGMVGPVTNFAGNEAKINVPYTSQTEMEEFADCYVFDHKGQSFEIKMLAMFCVAMRRKLIEEVGLLDERFGIGMFEDDDYAYRVKLLGYKLLCVEDVFVHHFGMSTMKKLDEQTYWALFTNNREKFERKWGIRWEPHKYRENKHI